MYEKNTFMDRTTAAPKREPRMYDHDFFVPENKRVHSSRGVFFLSTQKHGISRDMELLLCYQFCSAEFFSLFSLYYFRTTIHIVGWQTQQKKQNPSDTRPHDVISNAFVSEVL